MPHFFEPPILASEEQTQRASMFHAIAGTTVLVTTLFLVVGLMVLPQNVLRVLVVVGFLNTLGIILMWLNRNGRTREASILFVAGFLILIPALASTAGGIRAPALTASIPIVLTAGLLLGE